MIGSGPESVDVVAASPPSSQEDIPREGRVQTREEEYEKIGIATTIDGLHKFSIVVVNFAKSHFITCGSWIPYHYVAEPPNLMPHRSAYLPLDTKHLKENTKLLGSVGHPRREPENPHFCHQDHK